MFKGTFSFVLAYESIRNDKDFLCIAIKLKQKFPKGVKICRGYHTFTRGRGHICPKFIYGRGGSQLWAKMK